MSLLIKNKKTENETNTENITREVPIKTVEKKRKKR